MNVIILIVILFQQEVPHIQLSLCYHAMLGFVTIEVIAVRNVPKGPLGRNQG